MVNRFFFYPLRATIVLGLLVFVSQLNAQTFNYSSGTLNVDVILSHPCNGSTSNGTITYKVNSANGGSAILLAIGGPNGFVTPVQPILVGSSFTYTPVSPQAGDYDFIINDVLNNFNINTFPAGAPFPVTLVGLPSIAVNEVTRIDNSSCAAPNGQVIGSVSGGSQTPALAVPGSFTYTWTSGNGLGGLPLTGTFDGTSNLNLATQLSLGGLPGGTYILNIKDNYSACSQSRNFTITDPSPSLFNITSGSGTACSGSNFTVTLNGSDGAVPAPGAVYEILRNGSSTGITFPGTGIAPFNMTFSTASFTNGDVLTVRATNGSCTPRLMTGLVVLGVASSPTSAVLSGTTTICAGQSTNISVAIVGGTAPFSFTITGFGPVSGYASGTPIPVSPLITSTYTLSGLVTDANGCTVAGSGSATVTVNPTPTAVISALPGTLCAGSSSTLTFNLTGSGPFNVGYSDGFTTFNLSGISNGNTLVVTPVVTSTYTITSITDATGCIGLPGSATTVTVNPAPVSALLTGTATICAGQSTNLIVTIAGGTPNYGFTITGLGPIGAYTSGSAITVSPAVTTTYTLAGLVTDASGCTVAGSGSALVTVNPLPTATISSLPGSLCTGGSSTLTFTLTGTGPFTVGYSDGSTTFSLPNISTGHTVVVNPIVTTTYTITSVSDATTCVGVGGSATTITVNPSPTAANLSGASTICVGQSTNLSVVITGGVAPFSFTLTGFGAVTGYTSGSPIAVSPLATTTFSIAGLVTDANGCTVAGSGSALVTVNPLPTATISSLPGSLCTGGSSTLTFTLTGTGPFTVGYSDGSTTFSLPNISTGHTVVVSPIVTTTYTITSVSDATTCVGVGGSATTITVNPSPTAANLSGASTICAGQSTNLSVVIMGGVAPFSFTLTGFGAVTGYTSGSPISVSPLATTTFSIAGLVTDASGCTVAGSGSALVTVNPLPTATISSLPGSLCTGGSSTLTFTLTGTGPFTVGYSDGSTTFSLPNISTGHTVVVNPIVTTTYTITSVTDATTCVGVGGSATTITVNPSPTAANLSGAAAICAGQSTDLSVAITGGVAPFSFTITGFGAVAGYTSGSPISVSPLATTTFSIAGLVTDANGCTVAGSGSALVTVNALPVSPGPGIDTWVGDVYSDAGNVTVPYESGVDFSVPKYRGFIVESDFTSFGTSTYNSATDAFDLNLSNNIPLAAATICGSYLNNYSIRFRNTKTFAAGIYTFNFSSDDGVRFFIDNVAVPLTRVLVTSPANSFTNHAYLGYSSSAICLTGTHDLRIEYFENTGFSRLTADATFQPLTSPTVTTPVSVCVGGTSPTLAATTVDANATGFNWYSSTNVLLFTGASFTPNGAQLNMAVAGSTTFNVASIYSCGDGPTTPVVVNVINGISAALAVGATLDPVCIGGSSAITVDLSEAGVSYQLRTGVTAIGSAVIGNGGTINLPTGVLLATTTFNVFASVATCPSIQLTATKDVTVSGSINAGLTVTPLAAAICTGNATSIQIATSEVGVNYQLRDNSNNSSIGAAVAGTGGLISLPTGVLVATSTFNVLASSATCSIQLATTPTVAVSSALDQTLVVSASPNPVCVSGISIVSVALSEVGVSYQLRNGVTTVGAPVVGTGGTINLSTGALFATTTFNVFATLAPCPSVQLTNTVTVNVSGSINSSLAVTSAAPSVCSGSSTNVLVANSELGVSYQLRDNLNNPIGLLVAGTGLAAPISLPTGSLSSSGTFNVLASNATCSIQLTTTVSITVDVAPNTTLVVGATITPLCTGGTSAVTVSLSENGVIYQLRDGGVNVGAAVVGNGGTISLSTGPLLPTTTFNVLATSGTCPPIQLATTQTITVSGSLDSGLSVAAVNPSVCPNTATNVRVTASELGVTYQLRNNATNALVGSALAGTGGNLDLPTGNLAVNTIFNILASNGSCSAQLTNTSSVTVLLASDPLCTGGGTGTCATVVITPVPSPATCTLSNGSINFNINPAIPIVNPSGVKITITGISTTNSTIARTNFNNPAFPALPIGVYNYSIEYGDVSCLKTGQVTVDQSGTVGTPIVSNIVGPVCAGSSTGSLTLDVPGETGNILQWSLDGIAFTNFTAGSTITGVPAGLAPTFQRVISVRRNAGDPCNASVTIVIQDANQAISTTLTPTDATCSNNDGSILVGAVSGGVGPYTFKLNGTTITLPASNRITAKSGGNYTLTVIDSKNCQVDFATSINFPGLVNYTTAVNNPDCSGSGQNGSIVLTITSTGTFLAGITTDPIAPPTAFQNVVSAGSTSVTFGGLSKGTYYVSLTPTGAACPTKAPFVINSGPDQVDFSFSAQNILCFESRGGVAISAIKGSPLVNYNYEIVDATGAIVPASSVTPANPINQLQALGTVNLLGLTAGDYKIRLFQDQSAASGCVAPISSAFKSFTVLGPTAALDTLYVTRTISLPDQPTGTMLVGLKESQQPPYQVRLELKKPIDPLQAFLLDYTDFPPRNTQNLKIEYNIRSLFAGFYELKIRDALGCEKTYADIEIKVDVNIFIPNVFTPNEDGSNETFFIRNLPADSKVNVSNRWGAEVYSSSNYQNDWNGSNNADGVYFYRVVAGGNTFTGWVEIIRGK